MKSYMDRFYTDRKDRGSVEAIHWRTAAQNNNQLYQGCIAWIQEPSYRKREHKIHSVQELCAIKPNVMAKKRKRENILARILVFYLINFFLMKIQEKIDTQYTLWKENFSHEKFTLVFLFCLENFWGGYHNSIVFAYQKFALLKPCTICVTVLLGTSQQQ